MSLRRRVARSAPSERRSQRVWGWPFAVNYTRFNTIDDPSAIGALAQAIDNLPGFEDLASGGDVSGTERLQPVGCQKEGGKERESSKQEEHDLPA